MLHQILIELPLSCKKILLFMIYSPKSGLHLQSKGWQSNIQELVLMSQFRQKQNIFIEHIHIIIWYNIYIWYTYKNKSQGEINIQSRFTTYKLLDTNISDIFYWTVHLIKNTLYLRCCGYVFRVLVDNKTYVINLQEMLIHPLLLFIYIVHRHSHSTELYLLIYIYIYNIYIYIYIYTKKPNKKTKKNLYICI